MNVPARAHPIIAVSLAAWLALGGWILHTTYKLTGEVATLGVYVEVLGKQVAMFANLERRVVRLEETWGR